MECSLQQAGRHDKRGNFRNIPNSLSILSKQVVFLFALSVFSCGKMICGIQSAL
jgi:hypothetical protein